MSYSNCIKTVLDIQDPNISFEEDFAKEDTYKGKKCTYISGKLSYTPTHCEKCGIEFCPFLLIHINRTILVAWSARWRLLREQPGERQFTLS